MHSFSSVEDTSCFCFHCQSWNILLDIANNLKFTVITHPILWKEKKCSSWEEERQCHSNKTHKQNKLKATLIKSINIVFFPPSSCLGNMRHVYKLTLSLCNKLYGNIGSAPKCKCSQLHRIGASIQKDFLMGGRYKNIPGTERPTSSTGELSLLPGSNLHRVSLYYFPFSS